MRYNNNNNGGSVSIAAVKTQRAMDGVIKGNEEREDERREEWWVSVCVSERERGRDSNSCTTTASQGEKQGAMRGRDRKEDREEVMRMKKREKRERTTDCEWGRGGRDGWDSNMQHTHSTPNSDTTREDMYVMA